MFLLYLQEQVCPAITGGGGGGGEKKCTVTYTPLMYDDVVNGESMKKSGETSEPSTFWLDG